MIPYSTSIRTRPVKETLEIVQKIAPNYGITRVTETTRLDNIGCPVFASIRPAALSLCVNAGKGHTRLEAQVGAYMEALEFAFSEPGFATILTSVRTFRSIEQALPDGLRLFDFCPIFGRKANLESLVITARCEELNTGQHYELPADLILHPGSDPSSASLFGSSTNGLASGNTAAEASVHAIFELIERDVMSFSRVTGQSATLCLESLPAIPGELVKRVRSSGVNLVVRYEENAYALPYFEAHLIDEDFTFPNISAGRGLHYSAQIALVRAITEAIQSRLTHIHGGRDDLDERLHAFHDIYSPERLSAIAALSRTLQDSGMPTVTLNSVPSRAFGEATVDDLLQRLLEELAEIGFRNVFRAVLSPASLPLAVVKVVIPRMEHLNVKTKRIGPRLLARILHG